MTKKTKNDLSFEFLSPGAGQGFKEQQAPKKVLEYYLSKFSGLVDPEGLWCPSW